jgi:hypothetical protein
MNSIKRIIAILLALVLSLSICTVASAADNEINRRADALNRINVLYGSGSDYFLNDNIKRSEAAAFIVRILGKEKYVKENSKQYSVTNYKDIGKDQWYAAYIGYCSKEGIITGYPDGNYRPSEYISEKAFVKLILTALGYEYNKDFTWNTVFKKALEAGLLKDSEKYSAITDNTNYKRSGAVDVMYNALTLMLKNDERTLIQSLVNSEAVQRKVALELGLIQDAVITSVESVTAPGPQRLEVRLNEEIKNHSNIGITIYETNNKNNKLTAKLSTSGGKNLTIDTSAQTSDMDYTVELQNVEDMQGNLISSVIYSFKGYKNPEIKSDFFRISKVEAVDNSMIDIYFTQPININAEVALHYSIKRDGSDYVTGSFSNIKLKVIPGTDNGISLKLLNNRFYTGEKYTLTVSGNLMSNYGIGLMDGSGDKMDFTGNGQEPDSIQVISAVPEDDNTLIIEFNKAVDASSAITNSSYDIKKNGSSVPVTFIKGAVLSDSDNGGRIVKLGLLNPLEEGSSYDIKVRNIYDSFRIGRIAETTFSIAGVGVKKNMYSFIYAEAIDKGTISLFTERPLDTAFASNPAIYTILSADSSYSAVPANIVYNPKLNPYQVKLYLPMGKQLESGKTYRVRVSKLLKDHLGHSDTEDTVLEFSGTGSDVIKPVLNEAKIIGKRHVKVTLSQEISNSTPNTSAGNYYLEYKSGNDTKKLIPSSVGYIDPFTLIMKFDSLDYTIDYTLKASMIRDYSNQYSTTSSDGGNSCSVYMGEQ